MIKILAVVIVTLRPLGLALDPCSGQTSDPAWDEARRAKADLETFPGSAAHGDVCRDKSSMDFFCPVGCSRVDAAPFCVTMADAAQPCRVQRGAHHPRCTASDDPTVGDEVKALGSLERFGGSTSHGDVCRSPTGDAFFCPRGCAHEAAVPYCSEATDTGVRPCRVEVDSPGPPVGGGNSRRQDVEREIGNLRQRQDAGAAARDYKLVAVLQAQVENLSEELKKLPSVTTPEAPLSSAAPVVPVAEAQAVNPGRPVDAPNEEQQAPCVNEHASCGKWAGLGECEKNPPYMHSACRPACGLCVPVQ